MLRRLRALRAHVVAPHRTADDATEADVAVEAPPIAEKKSFQGLPVVDVDDERYAWTKKVTSSCSARARSLTFH